MRANEKTIRLFMFLANNGGDMTELKPCPFCGAEAGVELHQACSDNGPTQPWFTIGCCTNGCICEVDGDMAPYETHIDAIKAWNTRVEGI